MVLFIIQKCPIGTGYGKCPIDTGYWKYPIGTGYGNCPWLRIWK